LGSKVGQAEGKSQLSNIEGSEPTRKRERIKKKGGGAKYVVWMLVSLEKERMGPRGLHQEDHLAVVHKGFCIEGPREFQ